MSSSSVEGGNGGLRQKTILVTGASAGIGAALARRLGAEGARVHLAARRADKLDSHVAAIRATGASATPHACDITDDASVAELFAAIERAGHPLDAVVNTAAVLWLEPFHEQAEASWQAMLATNLGGAIRITQRALGQMLPRKAGHIVHLTSTAGNLAIPYLAVYSATKAGLAQFLAALRGEYGASGVRFTELQIGNTAGTEGGGQAFRQTTADMARQIMRWTGAPEMMAVDVVVDAIVWALQSPPTVRLDRIVLREHAEIPT
jgi:3-hydroxy acid dehydrogenase/malonic semialdehyde reductase